MTVNFRFRAAFFKNASTVFECPIVMMNSLPRGAMSGSVYLLARRGRRRVSYPEWMCSIACSPTLRYVVSTSSISSAIASIKTGFKLKLRLEKSSSSGVLAEALSSKLAKLLSRWLAVVANGLGRCKIWDDSGDWTGEGAAELAGEPS